MVKPMLAAIWVKKIYIYIAQFAHLNVMYNLHERHLVTLTMENEPPRNKTSLEQHKLYVAA